MSEQTYGPYPGDANHPNPEAVGRAFVEEMKKPIERGSITITVPFTMRETPFDFDDFGSWRKGDERWLGVNRGKHEIRIAERDIGRALLAAWPAEPTTDRAKRLAEIEAWAVRNAEGSSVEDAGFGDLTEEIAIGVEAVRDLLALLRDADAALTALGIADDGRPLAERIRGLVRRAFVFDQIAALRASIRQRIEGEERERLIHGCDVVEHRLQRAFRWVGTGGEIDPIRAERQALAAALRRGETITGDILKRARRALGQQQAALAAALGYRPETLSRWENGAAPVPRVAQLALVALLEEGGRALAGSVQAAADPGLAEQDPLHLGVEDAEDDDGDPGSGGAHAGSIAAAPESRKRNRHEPEEDPLAIIRANLAAIGHDPDATFARLKDPAFRAAFNDRLTSLHARREALADKLDESPTEQEDLVREYRALGEQIEAAERAAMGPPRIVVTDVRPLSSGTALGFVDGPGHHGVETIATHTYPESPRGEAVRAFRREHGISFGDLARALCVSPADVSGLERGSKTTDDAGWLEITTQLFLLGSRPRKADGCDGGHPGCSKCDAALEADEGDAPEEAAPAAHSPEAMWRDLAATATAPVPVGYVPEAGCGDCGNDPGQLHAVTCSRSAEGLKRRAGR